MGKDINEISIQNRHTSVIGKPALIYNTQYGKLSKTQEKILNRLEQDDVAKFNKAKDNISIDMQDLSALTAYTGVEFSLFSRNDEYIIVKGTPSGIKIDTKLSAYLINKKYTWTGHTHPGSDYYCLYPSEDDYVTLKAFNQKHSVIYNSVGNYYVFEMEDSTC